MITGFANRHVISETQNIIFLTFLGILVPVTIIANSLLAFALIKTKQLTKPTSHIFIFLLSISDLFMGAMTIPFDIILFSKYRHTRACKLELIATAVQLFNTQVSANMIFVIALHRYIQVNPDLREITRTKEWLISKNGSAILTLLAFIVAFVDGLLSSYFFGHYYNSIPEWILRGLKIVMMAIIFVLYLKLFCKIRRHTQTNSVLWKSENPAAMTQTTDLRPKYFGKLTVTVFLILIAIGLCYLPYIIMDICTHAIDESKIRSSVRPVRFLYFMSWGFVYINSTINAAIIISRNDKLKAFLREKVFHM